ncbi:MAG: hypothetical protein ACRCZ1_05715 [Cetobacterium sp.]
MFKVKLNVEKFIGDKKVLVTLNINGTTKEYIRVVKKDYNKNIVTINKKDYEIVF